MDIGEGDEGQDLKRLKDQANELRKQVEAIESAIKNLEKSRFVKKELEVND